MPQLAHLYFIWQTNASCRPDWGLLTVSSGAQLFGFPLPIGGAGEKGRAALGLQALPQQGALLDPRASQKSN